MTNPSAGPTQWPPSAGLTTPRVPLSSTVLCTSASVHVSAPAALVWSILLDTATYPNWNTFCPKVTIHSQPADVDPSDTVLHKDTSLTFDVVMDSSKPDKITPTQLRITDISTPDRPSAYIPQHVLESEPSYSSNLAEIYRISWTTEGGFVARGLRSERFHEIIPLTGADGGCEVRTWECQGGVLARAVKFYYKDVLKKKFAQWCEDLNGEAEKRVASGRGQGLE